MCAILCRKRFLCGEDSTHIFLKFWFFFPKLFWNFQKWTKKMSKIDFPKKVSEKTGRETIIKIYRKVEKYVLKNLLRQNFYFSKK